MASNLIDVCRFNPTAGGTTDWTYSSAVTGYQSPTAASAVNGATYSVRSESNDLSQWEVSVGACTITGGVPTFARTTVLFNNLGTTAKVNFTTVPQIAVVALAEDLTFANGATGGVTRLLPDRLTDTISAKDFGAKGNLISVTGNTSITSGAAALTVVGAAFVVADVGKAIQVPGAGAAGATLVTTISAWTSSTQVTLTANASTTLAAVSKAVTYFTDDTTALQNAITYAISVNKSLFIPAGQYAYSTLSSDHAIGFTIYGENAWGNTALISTQTTGTTPAFTVRSTFDVTLRFLTFSHTSATWGAGYMVDASHALSGGTFDTQGLYFERCGFTSLGNSLYVAYGVNLDTAHVVTFDGCKFISLSRPITGQNISGSSYSNVVRILNCQFADNVGYQINNLGISWHIEGCNFQACHDGTGRLLLAQSPLIWRNVSLVNCSAFDATAAGTSFLVLDVGQGLVIVGGMYGGRSDLGSCTFINATGIIQGIHMKGAYLSLFSNALFASVTGNKAWDVDGGNTLKTVTTFVGSPTNVSPTVTNTLNAIIP